MREIESNVRMVAVQCAVGVQAIALLGHGGGDEMHARIAQSTNHVRGRLACHPQFSDRTHDDPFAQFIEHTERVQAMLRLKRITHMGCLQRDFADSPARVGYQRPIRIPRLMNAMKCAGPEMHNAGLHDATVIRRHPNPTRSEIRKLSGGERRQREHAARGRRKVGRVYCPGYWRSLVRRGWQALSCASLKAAPTANRP
jgi:hypothetical protein